MGDFGLTGGDTDKSPDDLGERLAKRQRLQHAWQNLRRHRSISTLLREGERFAQDRSGATAVVMAIGLTLILLTAALAVDYTRAGNERTRLQLALDSAALAASDWLGLPDQDTKGKATARAFFKANGTRLEVGDLKTVKLDADAGEVTVTGGGSLPATLLRGLNINSIDFSARSKVAKGDGSVEVVLVLDNSGSMAGQPIADLRTAAIDLVSVIFAGSEGTEKVRAGVVPFAGAVNIGNGYAGEPWMDTQALSPVHHENFSPNLNRFSLFSQLGVPWRGCVEARPAPYDTNDAAATTGTPATLFVPLAAPDEPDPNNAAGRTYYNNYLNDAGGRCAPLQRTCTSYSRRGNCRNWVTQTLPASQAQERVCKYDGGNASTVSAYGTQLGPNFLCDTQAILPLTSTKASIETAINAMVARGGTNIAQGVVWGWRALSPAAPFTEGLPYDTPKHKKYLVLMSDGANWHGHIDNHNASWYTAYGYASKNRLGNARSTADLRAALNARTAQACANAKAAGITIFTVAFNLTDETTLNLLKGCASAPDQALVANGGASLTASFKQIAREISKLRVAG
ncbi:MAG: vWA domain-containing protein [Pseudomonadota bacterium]